MVAMFGQVSGVDEDVIYVVNGNAQLYYALR